MEKKSNINIITKNALCTACGACSGVCPKNAISMKHNTAGFLVADINDMKCINCGMCFEVCPSNKNNMIEKKYKDIFHGECLCGYVGYAADDQIRQKSQSGGIVTALLCYLVEQKMIDGAIVNNFNTTTRRPQAVFSSNKKEIIDGCGSYYSQSSVVKTILDNQEKEIAAVTLGCQSESLRFIKEKYPKFHLPKYTIGLVCAGQNSGYMIDDLIKQSKSDQKEKIKRFRFRDKACGGWPGNVAIYTEKDNYVLDKKLRHNLKAVYENYRCLLCYDQMNVFSDIVVGDPWGITEKSQEAGNSVVIARTEKGKKLIEDAVRDGAIYLETMSVERIINGQTVDNRHKTKFYTAMNISRENQWLFPYDELIFKDIKHQCADKKTKNSIRERMEYTRQLNLIDDNNEIDKIFNSKKNKIKRIAKIHKPIIFIKRCIRFVLRRLHIS